MCESLRYTNSVHLLINYIIANCVNRTRVIAELTAFELWHIFTGFINHLYFMTLSCILLMKYKHTLGFLNIYFYTNLLRFKMLWRHNLNNLPRFKMLWRRNRFKENLHAYDLLNLHGVQPLLFNYGLFSEYFCILDYMTSYGRIIS